MLALFDQTILDKYNTPAPRYTSYPTALSFKHDFNASDYTQAIEAGATANHQQALSLYIHIPFCHSLCYYCGCNKIVTRHAHKADEYIDYLVKEILSRANDFNRYQVRQIHFGGGTPSFLSATQLQKILSIIKSTFSCADQIDLGIEIDPRRIAVTYIDELACLGFNRLSIGVQDVNTDVQEKINRVQSTIFIHELVSRAKMRSFTSVNLDLIYGLPSQTIQAFDKTLDEIIAIDPDRISLFSYAHLPEQFAAQRKIKDEWLPNAQDKMALLQLSVNRLTQAGYIFIGMDHFAKPEDELCKALDKGELHRNFQGYTTKQYSALLGLGVSSISSIDSIYVQNSKDLKDYYARIDNGCAVDSSASTQDPSVFIDKGVCLSQDDLIRRDVIQMLICNFSLNMSSIENQHGIVFDQYFAKELSQLKAFEAEGLLYLTPHQIIVAEKGRMIIRHICMKFDAQLSTAAHHNRFSKGI